MTRIIIPVSDRNGLDAHLAEHFGRASFYEEVTLGSDGKIEKVSTVENKGEHFGGHGHMHEHLLELRPDVIITHGMGPRGLCGFQDAGISVMKANADTVKEVVNAYKENRLEKLIEGCHNAHHH